MVVTDPTDPIDYCYHPIYGILYRARLVNTLRLFDQASPGKSGDVVELGYGSGQFMPELSRRAERVSGLDRHETIEPVKKMLKEEGVGNLVSLESGDVRRLPYADASFDAVVSISTLEHVVEIDEAAAEIARILKPGAFAVLSFPNRNPVTDALFRFLGYSPRHIHPSSHQDIMLACDKVMKLEKKLVLWPWIPGPLQLYTSCLYRKR